MGIDVLQMLAEIPHEIGQGGPGRLELLGQVDILEHHQFLARPVEKAHRGDADLATRRLGLDLQRLHRTEAGQVERPGRDPVRDRLPVLDLMLVRDRLFEGLGKEAEGLVIRLQRDPFPDPGPRRDCTHHRFYPSPEPGTVPFVAPGLRG